jgi:5,10-methylenetetrahydromethanopterin reductase
VDVVSVFHDLLYQPAIGPLLLMARVTERVRLGPAALNPFTLHPYEIADRPRCWISSPADGHTRIVRGAWLERLGLTESRPARAAGSGGDRAGAAGTDRSGFRGSRFTLEPGTVLAYEPLRAYVPLLVGTVGPADGGVGRDGRGRAQDRRHGESGHHPGGAVVGRPVVVCPDRRRLCHRRRRGRAWARERARAAVAPYLDVVARLDPTLELRVGQEPPLERFAIYGTPEEVAARVVSLWEAGADRVELGTPQGRTTADGVRLICERVLPLLR